MSVHDNIVARTAFIDDYFLSTFYKIKAEAVDNILEATPIWAALKAAGCFSTKVGGKLITETLKKGTTTGKAVEKGITLGQGEPELETLASWTWRYISSHVQRNRFDDQQNSGEDKIKDYATTRILDATDTLSEMLEAHLMRTADYTEVGKDDGQGKYMQGLYDILPDAPGLHSLGASGATYGGLVRPYKWTQASNGVYTLADTADNVNPWMGSMYMEFETPREINLVSNMKTLYNSISKNKKSPNLILTDQDTFEMYSEFGLDRSQIVLNTKNPVADLGFDVLKFKGKDMIWSETLYSPTASVTGGVSATSNNRVMMLDTDFIKVVYDPNMWFDMDEFKVMPLTSDRIAHIMCAVCVYSPQLRRHGMLTSADLSGITS